MHIKIPKQSPLSTLQMHDKYIPNNNPLMREINLASVKYPRCSPPLVHVNALLGGRTKISSFRAQQHWPAFCVASITHPFTCNCNFPLTNARKQITDNKFMAGQRLSSSSV